MKIKLDACHRRMKRLVDYQRLLEIDITLRTPDSLITAI
jgi:hypothetical protein